MYYLDLQFFCQLSDFKHYLYIKVMVFHLMNRPGPDDDRDAGADDAYRLFINRVDPRSVRLNL